MTQVRGNRSGAVADYIPELAKAEPDYLGVAKQINQIDLYRSVASAMKINVPKEPLRTSKLIDGVVWDGKDPAKYADSFKIKA